MALKNESPIGALIVVALHLVLFAFFMRESWIQGAIDHDRATLQSAVGEEAAAVARMRADRWFRNVFVDSGVIENASYLFVPTAVERERSWLFKDIGEPQFTFAESRLRALWSTFYLGMSRVSGALVWWPYLGFVIAPMFVDAWVRRRIRRSAFGFASPMRHSWLRIVGIAFIYAATIGILLPYQLSAIAVPVFFIAGGALVSAAFANYAKYA
jgi:hypothetical protein